MKYKKFVIGLLCCSTPLMLMAAKQEKIVAPQEEFQQALSAYQQKQWLEVIQHARVVFNEHDETPFAADLYFYAGVAYFHIKDYELSNRYFSIFLEKYATPRFFEEAIEYKFRIADHFDKGARKHVMGFEQLPQWSSGRDDAYLLYDEVINTLPRHTVAAQSLFNKGRMLSEDEKFKESIESYQTLIRRFPKHPLAPESYLAIAQLFLKQSLSQYPDPDFFNLARINLKRFAHDFPGDPRLKGAEEQLRNMADRYAKDLWASASYYDKKRKTASAVLYYQTIIKRYPFSNYAHDAFKRLTDLKEKHPHLIPELEQFNSEILFAKSRTPKIFDGILPATKSEQVAVEHSVEDLDLVAASNHEVDDIDHDESSSK